MVGRRLCQNLSVRYQNLSHPEKNKRPGKAGPIRTPPPQRQYLPGYEVVDELVDEPDFSDEVVEGLDSPDDLVSLGPLDEVRDCPDGER